MSLFDLFRDKNPDHLKKDEIEAAAILQNIVKGYAEGNPDYIPGGIDKLSIGLYHLAFKRTNKQFVPLEQLSDPITLVQNPKLMRYFSVFKAIRETIKSTVTNQQVQAVHRDTSQFQTAILQVLQYSAKTIKEI